MIDGERQYMSKALGLENALSELSDGCTRIALVYDKAKGWFVTADVRARGSEYSVLTLPGSFCTTPADAVIAFRDLRVRMAKAEADLRREL